MRMWNGLEDKMQNGYRDKIPKDMEIKYPG